MKLINNIFKIFILGVFILTTNSCEEQWDLKDGGRLAANMYPQTDVAYLYQETDEVKVNLKPFTNEGVSITAINVTKQLITSGGSSEKVTLNVSGETFTQTKAELFEDVPVNGDVLTEDDLTAGDYWILAYTMTLNDGSELKIGDQTKIAFSCPSDIGGTYDASTSGTAGGGWGSFPPHAWWDGEGEVTLTPTDVEGVYEISEITGEFYNLFWGGNPEPGTFRDVCGNYSIDTKTDQWGDTLTTTVINNGDGTITIEWENTYGDTGTTELTPQ